MRSAATSRPYEGRRSRSSAMNSSAISSSPGQFGSALCSSAQVGLQAGVAGGVPVAIDRFDQVEKLAHLVERESEGLHASDEQQPLDVVVDVEAAFIARGGKPAPTSVGSPFRPADEVGRQLSYRRTSSSMRSSTSSRACCCPRSRVETSPRSSRTTTLSRACSQASVRAGAVNPLIDT